MGDVVQTILFYVLAVLAVASALVVVSSRRLLRAALALASVLVCSAGFYVMLGFEFLADRIFSASLVSGK